MRKIIITLCFLSCLLASVGLWKSSAAQRARYIRVAAGSLDRRETVVSFRFEDRKETTWVLRDTPGDIIIPLQVEANGQATFVIPELKGGSTKNYRLEEVKAFRPIANGMVQLVQSGDKINIAASGRQILSYQTRPGELPDPDIKTIFKRGGYIHPIYTPSGRIITDDYPPDHRHHHGIWFAWTKTEFEERHPDFWNVGDGTGTIDFVGLEETWSGPVCAGFRARNRYVDLGGAKPITVLNEEWKVSVYRVGQGKRPYMMFDLISTQENATASPLILPEYRYGGVGFRGHREWLEKDNCFFLTSEGKDRSNGHGTRARWCHIGGRIGGQLAGIAIFDHPDNFRAPQPMRISPDQPFFCFAPSQLGQWQIAADKPYISRYRFVVYDGPPDPQELERLWNDYANPPKVTFAID